MKTGMLVAVIAVVSFAAGLTLGGRTSFTRPRIHHLATLAQASAPNSRPELVDSGPPGDLTTIMSEQSPYRMSAELNAYVQGVPVNEMPQAFAHALAVGDGNYQAVSLLAGRWAELDPEGALAEMGKVRDENAKNVLVSAAFAALAAHDPVAAIARAQKLTGGAIDTMVLNGKRASQTYFVAGPSYQDQAIQVVLSQWAVSNPEEAFEASRRLKGPSAHSSIGVIFSHWAARDLDSAAKAAIDLPDKEDAASALGSVMGSVMKAAGSREIFAECDSRRSSSRAGPAKLRFQSIPKRPGNGCPIPCFNHQRGSEK